MTRKTARMKGRLFLYFIPTDDEKNVGQSSDFDFDDVDEWIILDIIIGYIHLLSLWGFFGEFKVYAKFMVVLLI